MLVIVVALIYLLSQHHARPDLSLHSVNYEHYSIQNGKPCKFPMLLGRHGSASLCRDGQKTKWRLHCKYERSNADISDWW